MPSRAVFAEFEVQLRSGIPLEPDALASLRYSPGDASALITAWSQGYDEVEDVPLYLSGTITGTLEVEGYTPSIVIFGTVEGDVVARGTLRVLGVHGNVLGDVIMLGAVRHLAIGGTVDGAVVISKPCESLIVYKSGVIRNEVRIEAALDRLSVSGDIHGGVRITEDGRVDLQAGRNSPNRLRNDS